MKTNKTNFPNVKTLDKSIAEDYNNGKITLHEAARQFCLAGWTNFVDEDAALKFMNFR